MSSCKCGFVKITKLSAPTGCSFQIGCPFCKGTAEAKT